MSLKDDLDGYVDNVLGQAWDIRDGQVVPTSDTVLLAGGGVKLEVTMLYADLADSTELAMWDRRVAARICKAYLECSSRLIRGAGGDIRSFDGDRVMGVFLSSTKNTDAAKCALKINWTFLNIIKPKFEQKYEALRNGTYKLAQTVGVDTSEVLVVRAGVRNSNDLIWLGRAPNVAAKMSGIRQSPYYSFITKEVYGRLNESAKTSSDGRAIWEACTWKSGPVRDLYRSGWTWTP